MECWDHPSVAFSKDVYFCTSFVPEAITNDFKTIHKTNIESIVKNLIEDGDIKNIDRIFIPVNFEDMHWLFIVLNVESKELEYYDSLWEALMYCMRCPHLMMT